MPANDGLFLGADPRRWNLLLKKIHAGEEPTEYVDGRLWYYDMDQHAYLEDVTNGPRQIALAGDPQVPIVHDNAFHSPEMVAYFVPFGSFYTAGDITVGSGAAVTIASVSAASNRWNIPSGGFNFRPAAGNTANRILSVWWESPLGTQRSAKYQLTVVNAESKRPFCFSLCHRDIAGVSFWAAKFGSGQTIYLRCQTDAESVVVSDRYLTVLQVGPT